MLVNFIVLSHLPFLALAWLPGEHKQILSRDGLDLFSRSHLQEAGLLRQRFLPNSYGNDKHPIRGVNLGSLFVLENWMAGGVMSSWGCDTPSEFDCVSSLNDQAQANSDFQRHWDTWITAADFTQMVSYGLNTVRIPIGYWFYSAIVDSSEHFPQGGEQYLDQVVGYAKDAGIYVILVLHGAPGGQTFNPSTGQNNPTPGFYNDYNYNRAYEFFAWITRKVHTNPNYATVGTIEILNEPQRTWESSTASTNAQSMRQTYYPGAWNAIRTVETSLNIPSTSRLHIMMMDSKWGSGDPSQYLPDTTFALYDNHDYMKYSSVTQTKAAYLAASRSSTISDTNSGEDSSGGAAGVIVGEWSLSVPTDLQDTPEWTPSGENIAWYKKWWAAQVVAYETTAMGWCFWSWKTQGLSDPRWDYRLAVEAGIIAADVDEAYEIHACGVEGGLPGTSRSNGSMKVYDVGEEEGV